MNWANLFKISLKALANNKMRAFLTMLGIIIGVAAVITMIALGQGAKQNIQSEISGMGSNMIMIHPGGERRGGVRLDPSEMQTLKEADYEALRKESLFLAGISPNVSSSGQLISGNNNYPSSVSGVSTDYIAIRQLNVEKEQVGALREDGRAPGHGVGGRGCHVYLVVAGQRFAEHVDGQGVVVDDNYFR